VSHDVAELHRLADRIVSMNAGRLVGAPVHASCSSLSAGATRASTVAVFAG
jgi:hypothetical protein